MKNILIVGNSAAGISAAENLRRKDNSAKITIVSAEDYTGYNRCLISYYLAGDINEDGLIYRPLEFYKENNIGLVLSKRALKIEPKKNQLILEDKSRLDYDFLVLACGASPKFPEIKGIQKKGVFGLRTVSDARQMLEFLPVTHTACILGGGLIGLKAAYAFKKRNLDVKVIVKSPQVLSQILDKEAASMFMQRLSQHGIDILIGLDVDEVIGNGEVKAIKLDSGKVIASSIVVVGKGVRPNIELAEGTGIEIGEGILVDDYLRTSIPNIYAAGDVAQAYDSILEKRTVNALWPNAVEQGMVVAENILVSSARKYGGSVGMNSVEFFGLGVISFGLTRALEDGYEELVYKDTVNNIYKKVVLKNNVIKGAIFVEEIENIGILLELARLKVDVSSIKDRLLRRDFNFADVKDLEYDKEVFYV